MATKKTTARHIHRLSTDVVAHFDAAGDAANFALLALVQLRDARATPRLIEFAHGALTDTGKDMIFPMPPAGIGINDLARLGTPEAMAALAEMRNDPHRGPIVQSALRSRQSPPNARQAWTMYLTAATSQPTTRALRNGMAMSVDPRDEWLGSVIDSADAGLRDEIAAAIPTTRPSDRPALRRAVREITRRLAPPTTQP